MLLVREVTPTGSRLSGRLMVRSSHLGPSEPVKKFAGVTAEPAKSIGFSSPLPLPLCPSPRPTLRCALTGVDGSEMPVNVCDIFQEVVIAPYLRCTLPMLDDGTE